MRHGVSSLPDICRNWMNYFCKESEKCPRIHPMDHIKATDVVSRAHLSDGACICFSKSPLKIFFSEYQPKRPNHPMEPPKAFDFSHLSSSLPQDGMCLFN
jgi:hypothetical protein